MKHTISLQINHSAKQIFKISYTSDGGYFVTDLIRYKQKNKKCIIAKFASDVLNHGKRTVTPHYQAYTTGEAKLSHHFDGRAQISGTGVLSGYDINGKPKGAAIQSFPLNKNNDSGPVFSFLVWGCGNLQRDKKDNDTLLIPNDKYIHSADRDLSLNAYVVKGFYLLKSWFPPGQTALDDITFRSKIEGDVKLTIVPSPPKTPGVIGLLATKANHCFKAKFGFTLSGAPGQIYNNRFCDSLNIIYPFIGSSIPGQNLDYVRTADDSA